jgi:hypothetical protein
MRMKGYSVKLNFYGSTTVFVTAPDYDEAEQLALEQADAGDYNTLDIEFEVESSELDDDES